MMGIRRTDRLWMLGGFFGIVVIVVAAYFLAIKPIYTDKAEKESQVGDQQLALVTLRTQLSRLKAEAKKQATFSAQLDAKTAALPDSYDMPDYLRALQTSGTAVAVTVSGISVGAPAVAAGVTDVVSIPINLTATGEPANLTKFIDRLQDVQARAVLVTSLNMSGDETSTESSATLTVAAFCRKSAKCTTSS
jgi:Tfp pilus assembly protein PilO